MNNEEQSKILMTDEELSGITGGVSRMDRLVYAYQIGNRVECNAPGQAKFVGEIKSKEVVVDWSDHEYYPAYLVRPDGGSHDVKVSECFMKLI